MVATRSRSGRLASPSRGRTTTKSPAPAPRSTSTRGRSVSRKPSTTTPASKSWADTAGAGDRQGAWGVGGAAGVALSYGGTIALMVACPAFAIYL